MTTRAAVYSEHLGDLSLVPAGYAAHLTKAAESHLRWMQQKDSMGQDMFLLGPPGSLRRRIAMYYCEWANREVEHLVITRDTTEAELKQRREIVKGKGTVYTDSAPVRAAVKGRVLLVDGIEKAERNVLPTLNNLLENREVQLDDGRFLMNPTRYDRLENELGDAEMRRRRLVRVSERFRVIALGLPVPPFPGSPLDPPLRSRFQARFIGEPSVAHTPDLASQWPRLATAIEAINTGSKGDLRFPMFTSDALARAHRLLQLPQGVRPTPSDAVHRVYPVRHLAGVTGVKEALSNILQHFGLAAPIPRYPLPSVVVRAREEGGEAVLQYPGGVSLPILCCNTTPARCDGYIATPELDQLQAAILHDFACGHDVCLLGPAGSGKSHFVRHLAASLGYKGNTEYIFMFGDMTSRDMVQRRTTDPEGSTEWVGSAVIEAARKGHLLVLDGLNRVHSDLLMTIAPLIQDRQLALHARSGCGGVEVLMTQERREKGKGRVRGSATIHPSFRIIAIAQPPTPKEPWLSEEAMAMFSFHDMPRWGPESAATVVCGTYPTLDRQRILPPLVALSPAASAAKPAASPSTLTLRQIMKVARAAAAAPGLAVAAKRAADSVSRQLLLSNMPPPERRELQKTLVKAFGTEGGRDVEEMEKVDISYGVDTVTIGSVTCPLTTPRRPERVPQVEFIEIAKHMKVMEQLAREFCELGERYVMLLGPQGVGKNRITDYFLQVLQWERVYMQLHRDTTVQHLTATPQLVEGKLVWEDSPLVVAATEGLCLMLDEADKAPLEVVVLLKSLVEDGYLALADGRRIMRDVPPVPSDDVIPLHPSFRIIVLGNRPGYPFLGNDLFRECGDVFSVFVLENPDPASELHLVTSAAAPNVDRLLLRRLVAAFAELREQHASGRLAYPYSTRELLHVARHLQADHETTVTEALGNVLHFDKLDGPVATLLIPIFERHGLPVADVFRRSDAPEHETVWERADRVLKEVQLGKAAPLVCTSHRWERSGEVLSVSPPVLGCGGSNLPLETPTPPPLEQLLYTRSYQFSEKLVSFRVPIDISTQCVVVDGATSDGKHYLLTEAPVVLWQVSDPLGDTPATHEACCMVRWGGYGGNASGKGSCVVNGRLVGAGSAQIAILQSGVGVFVPGDAAQLLVVSGVGTQTPTAKQFRVPSLRMASSGPSSLFYLVPVVPGDDPPRAEEVMFHPSDSLILFSPTLAKVVHIDAALSVQRTFAFPSSPVTGVVSATATSAGVVLTSGNHAVRSPCFPRTQRGSPPPVTFTPYNHPFPPGHLTVFSSTVSSVAGHVAHGGLNDVTEVDTWTFAEPPQAQWSVPGTTGWRGSISVNDAGMTLSHFGKEARATTIDRIGGNAVQVLQHCNPVEGALATVVLSDGTMQSYQLEPARLIPSLVTYLKVRGLGGYVDAVIKNSSKQLGMDELLHGVRDLGKRAELKHKRRLELEHSGKDRAATSPKVGKVDGKKHVGGNQFAGGSGGADTAGLGGKGGPFRLDLGHDVHQISDELKKNISKEAAEAARKMGREALEKKLKEIDMGSEDFSMYRDMLTSVEREVATLRGIFQRLEAASRERVWLKGTEGELDDNRLVDALTGESAVFKRRGDKRPKFGEVQLRPKRMVFLFDVSASMYRFNGVDGRLRMSLECATMLMEALSGFDKQFEWALIGHSGDSPEHVLVPFGSPPRNEAERFKVVQRMSAHAQYCASGDNTLEGISNAAAALTARDVSHGLADEKLLFAFSDANLDRYSISASQLDKALVGGTVHSSIFFLVSSDGEAERLCQQVASGRAHVALDLKNLPLMLKTAFADSVARSGRLTSSL